MRALLMGFSPIFYFWIMDLQALIESTVVGLGYEMVALERIGRGLLRVYIDRPQQVDGSANPAGIGLDDCEKVSRQLTRVFEVENVDYDRLEVSSPGLDRPLVKPADFARFAGHKAQLRLRMLVEGRKRYSGVLQGVQDAEGGVSVLLQTETATVAIPFAEIDAARLIPEF